MPMTGVSDADDRGEFPYVVTEWPAAGIWVSC